MNRLLIGAAALGVSIAAGAQMNGPAMVQTPVYPMPRSSVDQGGGRVQTRDELIAKIRLHFAKLDTNRDGFIDSNEMKAMHDQHMGAGDDRHGADGDMAMRDGPMGNPGAMFDRLDANHDGMLSRDEFAKGRELRIEHKMVINGDGDDHGEMMKHQMGGGMGGGMGGHLLEMADTNHDGRVSLQELTAVALQRFDRLDTNHDGKVTPDERKAAHHGL